MSANLAEQLREGTLSERNLAGAQLDGEDLSGLDLSGADLSGARLRRAKLVGTQLMGADLTGAELFGADLTEAQLLNARLTEADLRLFVTLMRFDAIYHGHFKCNLKRLADYPALSAYVRDLYQQPGVAGTLNFEHNRRHYYESHGTINPTGVVAVGPELRFDAPHQREALAA